MKKGFTLIELLIVIAILGTLAVVALIAIDPLEQLARSRDSGRMSTVAQLGHAVQAFATGDPGGEYPPEADWAQDLVDSGELQSIPGSAGGTLTCAGNPEGAGSWCYDLNATGDAIVYSALESTRNNSLCTSPAIAWGVYSTVEGRAGVVCRQTEPTGGAQTFEN